MKRRSFFKATGSTATMGLLGNSSVFSSDADGPSAILRFGIVTDSHYADRPPSGVRHYRQSLQKMKECVTRMNEERVDFLVELGDFKDEGVKPFEAETLRFLTEIEAVFAGFNGPRYHVLGNHDLDSLSKKQFLSVVENTGIDRDAGFYSFNLNNVHLIVLDSNFTADGSEYDHGNFHWKDSSIPPYQLQWLKDDLSSVAGPVLVFNHHRLDGDGDHTVSNASEVRHILRTAGNVTAVFQGHKHVGDYRAFDGIHFCTMRAMVDGDGAENSAYAIVEVFENGELWVEGYRREADRRFAAGQAVTSTERGNRPFRPAQFR